MEVPANVQDKVKRKDLSVSKKVTCNPLVNGTEYEAILS